MKQFVAICILILKFLCVELKLLELLFWGFSEYMNILKKNLIVDLLYIQIIYKIDYNMICQSRIVKHTVVILKKA